MENILENRDIILSKNASIEMILNENYSNLFFCINSYFKSLLLDIRLGKILGYCFYNDINSSYDLFDYNDIELIIQFIKSQEDIEYLQMLILKKLSNEDILEQFFQNSIEEYKKIEKDLKIYIDIVKSILIDKIN